MIRQLQELEFEGKPHRKRAKKARAKKPLRGRAKMMREIEVNLLKERLNMAAFKRLLPSLLKTDRGRYVVLFDGAVVDKDDNELTVVMRAARKFHPTHLLVRRVLKNEKPRVGRIETPFVKE